MIENEGPEQWDSSHAFEEEFKRQLGTIGDIPIAARTELIAGLEAVGVAGIQKFSPAVSFYFPEFDSEAPRRELWISRTQDIEHPHDAIFDDACNFINSSPTPYEPPIAKLSCYILQDKDNALYLVIGREDVYEFAEEAIDEFEDMARRYEIKKIVGNFGSVTSMPKTILSVENNIVEEMREELYIIEYAKKWKMTNSQYLRFHTLIKAGHVAHKSAYGEFSNYGELAKSIVLEDDGHL